MILYRAHTWQKTHLHCENVRVDGSHKFWEAFALFVDRADTMKPSCMKKNRPVSLGKRLDAEHDQVNVPLYNRSDPIPPLEG